MLSCLAVILAIITTTVTPAKSADLTEAQHLVEKARITWESFAATPALSSEVRDWLRIAKGVFIVPQILRGAAMFGLAGGSGVLLVRDEKTGEWSDPAFYTVRSLSFGLQVGADASELIIVVRSEKGYNTSIIQSSSSGLIPRSRLDLWEEASL